MYVYYTRIEDGDQKKEAFKNKVFLRFQVIQKFVYEFSSDDLEDL